MNRIMIIAGETSGDQLAAELVHQIRGQFSGPDPIDFAGAGGPSMAAAGVRIFEEMTRYTVFGVAEVLRRYFEFRAVFTRLLLAARSWQPRLIILVDFGGFNLRFASAIKRMTRDTRSPFKNWHPKIVDYVSPQVWASRSSRAYRIARDVDLLLSLFPFEKDWYARRTPNLWVEFVGDPMADRYRKLPASPARRAGEPHIVLLPGSRSEEIRRHLPVMLEALEHIRRAQAVTWATVLPHESAAEIVRACVANRPGLAPCEQVGGVSEALSRASLAIASSGSVTRECAYHRVPAVVIYKVAWLNYQVAKRLITVPYIAMPNLLAGKSVFPELIQGQATPAAIASEGVDLLRNQGRREVVLRDLELVIERMDRPNAVQSAARHVVSLLSSSGAAPG